MSKKIIIVGVCAFIAIAIAVGGKSLYEVIKYKKIISDIVITTPDISRIQDGIYRGNFDAILVAANVDVTIQNHMITKIKLNKHKNGRGINAEKITEEVVAKQSLEVDTVSGATSSSKVILKATETALESGVQ